MAPADGGAQLIYAFEAVIIGGIVSKRWDAPWFPIRRHLILKTEEKA